MTADPVSLSESDLRLQTSVFAEDKPIPKRYTGDGEDVSPPLNWIQAPAGTKEFALICDDPDAPRDEPWVHWVLYKIPGDVKELPEGIPRQPALDNPPGARQGPNSFPNDNVGYRGPMPPPGHGRHRYYFNLYALDAEIDLSPEEATKEKLLAAMRPHILAETHLMGTYERT
ncbi:MAG: YbhB/YbcL family Raf kinase inhibitor-like protein [Planctomycetes bacterium]|nr:YbhB/YbcL family Raf kinase inhibitor-like protein [Planctomycetota bacterium]